MPIKDVFLPLVGQPRGPALAAIEKCVAVAADLGARITALALEDDVFVRPKWCSRQMRNPPKLRRSAS
jgi:hypothetical protein